MRLRKIAFAICISYIFFLPIQSFASGTLSGVGLLVEGEDETEPDIYQVTFPTGSNLGIILDPMGLMSISEKGEYDSSWAGMVHMEGDRGALFINRSSFPVSVKVGISIDQDTNGTPSSIMLLEKEDYVDQGGWPQMYLTAIPGAAKIQSISEFVPSDTSIPILTDRGQGMTEFSFLLKGSDYVLDEYTGEYVLADYEDNYDSASFILGGRVNRNADWSDYTGDNKEPVIVHTVYTLQKQESYDEECLYHMDEGMRAPHALIRE